MKINHANNNYNNNKYKAILPYKKMKEKLSTYQPKKIILQIMVQVLPKERAFIKTLKTIAIYKFNNNKIPSKTQFHPIKLGQSNNKINNNNNNNTIPNKPSS